MLKIFLKRRVLDNYHKGNHQGAKFYKASYAKSQKKEKKIRKKPRNVVWKHIPQLVALRAYVESQALLEPILLYGA